MQSNNWSFQKHTFLSYQSGPIKVTQENVKEIILSLDQTIIDSGEKFGIFKIIPSDFFDFEKNSSLGNQYYQDRIKNFWPEERGHGIYSILQLWQWEPFLEHKISEQYDYPKTELIEFGLDGEFIKKLYGSGKNQVQQFHPSISIYSNSIKWDTNDSIEKELEIFIESSVNIWFEEIENKQGEIVDNKSLAYQNAPRLNSFFREIGRTLKKFNSYLLKSEEDNLNDCIWDKGIALDNQILYQENI